MRTQSPYRQLPQIQLSRYLTDTSQNHSGRKAPLSWVSQVMNQLPFLGLRPAQILVVLAHPDDEVLTSGIASLLGESKSVQFVYATSGEAGQDVSGLDLKGASLASARELEQHSALRALDIKREPLFLHYHDGGLDTQKESLKADLMAILQATRPQVVLTFGPDGFTGHPDHILVGKATYEAAQALSQSKQYALTRFKPPQFLQMGLTHEAYQQFMKTFTQPLSSSWVDVKPMAEDAHAIKIPIPHDVIQRKLLAIASHRTQFPQDDLESFKRFQEAFPFETFQRLDITA